MKIRVPIAALISASLLLAGLPAMAQDSDAALRKRVDELEKRLLEVESQLKNLQAPIRSGVSADGAKPAVSPSTEQRTTFAPAAPAQTVVSYPAGWLKVKEGMSQAEIKELIGPAHKSFELNGSQVWYYAYSGVGVGSVFFDSTGHASGYQRPSPWRLW